MTNQTSPAAVAAVPRGPRYELTFLDGLRALAALYVVLYHAYFKLLVDKSIAGSDGMVLMPFWSRYVSYGHFAVDVFIVLSGFLLALPVAVSAGKTLEGGIGKYIKRRARRILPPYYAALILSCLLLLGSQLLGDRFGIKRDVGEDLRAGPLFSHLLLVHNLIPGWDKLINAPLWSVATEWQIYFVFPLVLIPLWQRFGVNIAFLAGLTLGVLPRLLGWGWADSAQSWQLGLFALGMIAASRFSLQQQISATPDGASLEKQRKKWGMTGLVLTAAVILLLTVRPQWYDSFLWEIDLIVGAATICLILYCAPVAVKRGVPRPLVLRLMESRPMQGVGHFSYSLYLTHGPLLALLYVLIKHLHLSVSGTLVVLMMGGTLVSLFCAYLFYLLFERPFTKRHGAVSAGTPNVAGDLLRTTATSVKGVQP